MLIFTCFTDGLFAKGDEEADFLEKLSVACEGANVKRTDGCTDNAQTVVITVYDAPARDEQFPVSGPRSALGRVAHAVHDLLGEKINKLTVVDASGHHPRYQIRIGDAATNDA